MSNAKDFNLGKQLHQDQLIWCHDHWSLC